MTIQLIKRDDYSINIGFKRVNNKHYLRLVHIKDKKSTVRQLSGLVYTSSELKDFQNSRVCKNLFQNKKLIEESFNKVLNITVQNKLQNIRNISFGEIYNNSKRRALKIKIPFNLTIEYLQNLYDENKNCSLTNIPLILQSGKMNSISLDRKDNLKGYEIGNVQYVCKAINLMKNNHSNNETLKFLTLIRTTYKKKYFKNEKIHS